MWDEYARLRSDSYARGGDGSEATEFYRRNRQAMDAGARVAWPDRYEPGEVSAVQHVMNLRADRGEAAFCAEYQNEPQIASGGEALTLSAADVARMQS